MKSIKQSLVTIEGAGSSSRANLNLKASWVGFLAMFLQPRNAYRKQAQVLASIPRSEVTMIFLRGMIKFRSISCWWARNRHLYWLHYFHPMTPLFWMAIPLDYSSHSCFEISAAFIAMQGSLILAISSICLSLSAMVKNKKCLQRMLLLKYTCEYKFCMGFHVHIVYILQIFSCWQLGLSINPLRTWLHWKSYYN